LEQVHRENSGHENQQSPWYLKIIFSVTSPY
jgi:hypothetical protein